MFYDGVFGALDNLRIYVFCQMSHLALQIAYYFLDYEQFTIS